ncbi:AlpA family transcriptional regulator [Pseudomonas sp. URMO17WK12:I2]|uniref:helix-turn-helix transcriptional regulator n=1 Tax=Pseudomonas sp. URMO17WK12:I2 TaxID=1261623 RepID=UPI000DACAF3F|nr:AlpA family phage regulatory protein [Pseudomonas sp. URMO17WK12:I2]PZW40205.1 AlpA family transcriptional regulator [Pseudomonas sp. URMO17WK12:I2]
MNVKNGNPQEADPRPIAAVLRLRKVVERLGISRSTIYDWMNPKSPRHDPTFPLPIKLSVSSRGAVGWLESEICWWLESRRAITQESARK